MSAENEISAESVVEAIVKDDAPNGEYVLDGKTIKGKFDLRHRVISIAIKITNCTFEDEVDLGYCEFKQRVDFSVSRFKKEVCGKAIYQKNIICNQATFEDGVIFNGCICEGTGFFKGAKFENVEKEIDFSHAKFGVVLDCIGAIFKGGANFNTIQCEGYGFFRYAKFENVEKEIDFGRAKFGVDLDCIGAVFKGSANFNTIQCEGNGFFRDAKFENVNKEIDFRRAKFGVDLDCTGVVFKGGTSFNSIQCEGAGFFRDTKFENIEKKTNFTYTKFSVNLEFQNATFAGDVDFLHAQVSRSFVLRNTKFWKHVNLNCVDLHNFSLMDARDRYGSDSLPFENDVDLRRLSFTVFQGTKEQQRHVVEKQAPDKFSMDPYLQFEKYYNSIGDESYAKDVYYEGRKKLHKYARSKENPDINWSWGKLKLDFFYRWLVGYGVKLWIPVIWLLIFLFVGVKVFWSDETIIPKTVSANNTGFMMTIEHNFQNDLDKGILSESLRQQFKNKILPISDQAYIVTIQYGNEWYINSYSSNDVIYKAKMKGSDIRIYRTIYPDYKSFFHRLGYSLDMLLPVVNLGIADEYKFPSDWRGVYMVIHILAGWILIPLLISSLAGVLRKR